MSFDLNNTQIVFNLAAQGDEELLQNVKTILTTPAGSVAFDRDFGIDWTLLDNPVNITKAKLSAEYVRKIRRYEPRVVIISITFTYSSEGIIIPKVVIGRA